MLSSGRRRTGVEQGDSEGCRSLLGERQAGGGTCDDGESGFW